MAKQGYKSSSLKSIVLCILHSIKVLFSSLGKISLSVKSYSEIVVNCQIAVYFHQITTEIKTMFQTKTAAPKLSVCALLKCSIKSQIFFLKLRLSYIDTD